MFPPFEDRERWGSLNYHGADGNQSLASPQERIPVVVAKRQCLSSNQVRAELHSHWHEGEILVTYMRGSFAAAAS